MPPSVSIKTAFQDSVSVGRTRSGSASTLIFTAIKSVSVAIKPSAIRVRSIPKTMTIWR